MNERYPVSDQTYISTMKLIALGVSRRDQVEFELTGELRRPVLREYYLHKDMIHYTNNELKCEYRIAKLVRKANRVIIERVS